MILSHQYVAARLPLFVHPQVSPPVVGSAIATDICVVQGTQFIIGIDDSLEEGIVLQLCHIIPGLDAIGRQ